MGPEDDVIPVAVLASSIGGVEEVEAKASTTESMANCCDGFRTGVVPEPLVSPEQDVEVVPRRMSGIPNFIPRDDREFPRHILFPVGER